MSTTTLRPAASEKWVRLHQEWLINGLVIGRVRSAKAAVAIGIQLCVIKSALPHGEFNDRVNALGIEASTARRYMAMAKRFHAAPDAFFDAIGSASKLFEMLPLEDAQALAQGKPVGVLTLEAISGMTAKELRRAIQQHKCDERFVPLKVVEKCATVRLNVQEERMLRRYRKCRPEAQEALLHMAGLLMPAAAP